MKYLQSPPNCTIRIFTTHSLESGKIVTFAQQQTQTPSLIGNQLQTKKYHKKQEEQSGTTVEFYR